MTRNRSCQLQSTRGEKVNRERGTERGEGRDVRGWAGCVCCEVVCGADTFQETPVGGKARSQGRYTVRENT